jgi:hypothetical protein
LIIAVEGPDFHRLIKPVRRLGEEEILGSDGELPILFLEQVAKHEDIVHVAKLAREVTADERLAPRYPSVENTRLRQSRTLAGGVGHADLSVTDTNAEMSETGKLVVGLLRLRFLARGRAPSTISRWAS